VIGTRTRASTDASRCALSDHGSRVQRDSEMTTSGFSVASTAPLTRTSRSRRGPSSPASSNGAKRLLGGCIVDAEHSETKFGPAPSPHALWSADYGFETRPTASKASVLWSGCPCFVDPPTHRLEGRRSGLLEGRPSASIVRPMASDCQFAGGWGHHFARSWGQETERTTDDEDAVDRSQSPSIEIVYPNGAGREIFAGSWGHLHGRPRRGAAARLRVGQ